MVLLDCLLMIVCSKNLVEDIILGQHSLSMEHFAFASEVKIFLMKKTNGNN